jgi:hypothetical protein
MPREPQQQTPAQDSPGHPAARFAAALAARREHYNQRFRMTRALRPGLDAEAFARSLRQWLAPLVEALAEASPEHTDAHTEALFEVALALLQAGHAGALRPSEQSGLDRLWQLFARQSAALGPDPVTLVAQLCNGWLHLQGLREVRSEAWLAGIVDLLTLAAKSPAPTDTLLRAAQVLAWRSGVATFRQSALAGAAALPPPLLAIALGLPEPPDASAAASLLKHLRGDPWRLAIEAAAPPSLHEVGRVGGFRGLGGCFVEVPEVVLLDGRIALQDRSGPLQILYADSYGAQLSTDASGPPTIARQSSTLELEGQCLRHRPSGSALELPGEVASWACDGHTAAVVLRRSYKVRLYAVCRRAAGARA